MFLHNANIHYDYVMENPFEFGRELDSRELVNRSDELQIVRESILTSGKLFIIGPRRFGKTSLLNAVAEEFGKKGDIILNYNAEAYPDTEQLVRRIIEDSARHLKGKIEKIGEQVKLYFKNLRPEVSFSATQTDWKATLGANVASNAVNPTELLVDALNGLEKLAADLSGEKKVCLIIDEFQEILSQDKIAAEKQIRAAVQKHPHTAYIFAGSKTQMLAEMITDPSRPFYRLGTHLSIGKIPKPEFAQFLVDKFTKGGFFAPKTKPDEKRELAHLIIELADDVPYNVQMLAHFVWNRLSVLKIGASDKAYLSEDLIGETLDKLSRQSDAFYTQVWNGLTANQKKALAAVAAENGQNLQSKIVTNKAKMSVSTMQTSLKSLVSQDILRQEEKSGTVIFVFEDPFFAYWIKCFTFLQ